MECDRRISRAKERIMIEEQPRPLNDEDNEKVTAWDLQVKQLTELAEKAGEEGNVDAAEGMLLKAEGIKKMCEEFKNKKTAPERTLNVCEVRCRANV